MAESFAIGDNQLKQVLVDKYKGKVTISIRNMYRTAEGEVRPTPKGVVLSLADWRRLLEARREIEQEIERLQK